MAVNRQVKQAGKTEAVKEIILQADGRRTLPRHLPEV
jgi:hypothetical protein